MIAASAASLCARFPASRFAARCLKEPGAAERRVLLRKLPDAVSESLSAGCRRPLRSVPQRPARFRRGVLLRLLRRHAAGTDPSLQVRPDEAAGAAAGGSAGAALPRDERFDAVVPVPLHWRRQWQRGFNQSELLARAVCAGVPAFP